MFTAIIPTTNDANACLTSGMYSVGDDWLNVPTSWGILITFHSQTYYLQLFQNVGISSMSFYLRHSNNGTIWSEWKEYSAV